jgi:thioredoxin 1
MPVTDLSSEEFDRFPAEHPAAAIYVFTPTCGPCRAMGPAIERVAARFEGRIAFGKFDVEPMDRRDKVRGLFGALAIPQLHLYRDGRLVQKLFGGRSESSIADLVEDLL